jgi:hypothetical protein
VVPVVSGIGAARELPSTAVVPVGPAVTAQELGTVVADLLADPDRRNLLAASGRAYAADHTYAALAQRLFDEVIEPASRAGLSVRRST